MSNSLMTSRRFAPLVLVPVLLGVQRQLPEERARLPDPVPGRIRREHQRLAGDADSRDLHRAVLLPLRARRPVGRPLRQGDHGALGQACRDRRRGARRRRLLAALRADHVRHAVPVRRDRDAVRPDQVRHPARSPEEGRTARRQRAGRRRDLHGDPARHYRRRPRRERGQPPCPIRRDDHGVLAAVLGLEPAHPAHRTGRTQSRRRLEHRALDRRAAERPLDRPAGSGGAGWSRAGSGWSARSRSR